MEEKYVPPVKEVEPDDPMEFNGVALPGNTMSAMAEVFVEEFVMMGYSDAQLVKLFKDPFFVATYTFYREKGESAVKELLERVRSRFGELRFRTQVAKEGEHNG